MSIKNGFHPDNYTVHVACDPDTKEQLIRWYDSLEANRRKAQGTIGHFQLDMRKALAKKLGLEHPYVQIHNGELRTPKGSVLISEKRNREMPPIHNEPAAGNQLGDGVNA